MRRVLGTPRAMAARQALLVVGEPGIGKTRFSDPGRARASTATARASFSGTARRSCGTPTEPGSRRCPISSSTRPTTALAAYVERHGGELTRLAAGLARRVPDAPPPRQSGPRDRALPALLGGRGPARAGEHRRTGGADARRPALGGPADARAAAPRGRRDPRRRACWCSAPTATATSRASTRSPTCSPTCAARSGVERLALRGLGEDAVVSIMEAAAGHELDATGLGARARDHRRDGRQPVLRGRDAAPPLGVRRARAQTADGRWELRHGLEELGHAPERARGRAAGASSGSARTVAAC